MGKICGIVIVPVISDFFEETGYICHPKGDRNAFIVDPGQNTEPFITYLRTNQLNLEAILLTHSHLDHIAGVRTIKNEFRSSPIITSEIEAPLLINAVENLSSFLGFPVTSPPADKKVQDEESINLCGFQIRVVLIPGHSPGHVAFILPTDPKIIFGGDILFRGSVGRCDFPKGNFKLLLRGIKEKLFNLPDNTHVFPGHGEPTTIGEEKKTNPFLVGLS